MAAPTAVVVLALGGYLVWGAISDGLPTSVPSCSWPLRVRGQVTGEQAGLIRCYLRALASRDAGGMLAVADTTDAPAIRITSADFAHAAGARSGTATATFTPNPNDDAYFLVTITFADDARESLSMVLTNPATVHSWRLQIGTHTGAPGPSPASTGSRWAPPDESECELRIHSRSSGSAVPVSARFSYPAGR